RQYQAFRDGDVGARAGAEATVRLMRTMLGECGVECPPWKDFPVEDA
ncbi:hypothetical protein LCGC14_2726330, partial [marine sediment metagenome]